MEAGLLLRFLQQCLPVRSRGVARLLLNLAEHARLTERQDAYLAELAWWSGIEEAESLTKSLIEQLEAGESRAELIWQVVNTSANDWPPYRRMAVLEAYSQQPGGIPLNRIGDFHYTRGRILRTLGQYSQALEDGRWAVEIFLNQYGAMSQAHAAALTLCGLAYIDLGELNVAREPLERALDINKKALGEEHPDLAASLDHLAGLYRAQGRYSEAEPLYREALEMRQRLLGNEHPDVAASLDSLGELYRAQGLYEEAARLESRTQTVREDQKNSHNVG
jgi:tetratricopeptide (TPR) repeat protein